MAQRRGQASFTGKQVLCDAARGLRHSKLGHRRHKARRHEPCLGCELDATVVFTGISRKEEGIVSLLAGLVLAVHLYAPALSEVDVAFDSILSNPLPFDVLEYASWWQLLDVEASNDSVALARSSWWVDP